MSGNNLTKEDIEEYGRVLKPEPRIKKTDFLDTVVKEIRNTKTENETKLILANLVMSSMMDSYIRNECVNYCDRHAPRSNIEVYTHE